jgi:uracil-DNA glycosylase
MERFKTPFGSSPDKAPLSETTPAEAISKMTVRGQGNFPTLEALLESVRSCRACERHLPHAPRPVLQAGEPARILVVGQAPGARVSATGIPWNDASGARLRAWMGVDSEVFYDASRIAIIPMGFCYPGRGRGGDLPPRRECAPLWMDLLLSRLTRIEVTLLVGRYAQRHFLGARGKSSLTETVRAWREYAPRYFPLPHPSPRNQPWFRRNPWFEQNLVLELRGRIEPLASARQHSYLHAAGASGQEAQP